MSALRDYVRGELGQLRPISEGSEMNDGICGEHVSHERGDSAAGKYRYNDPVLPLVLGKLEVPPEEERVH
jgi:hypothetical protein